MVSDLPGHDSTVLVVQVLQTPQDEVTMLSQNSGNQLPSDAAPYPRRAETSATLLQEPKYLNTSYPKKCSFNIHHHKNLTSYKRFIKNSIKLKLNYFFQ